MSWKCQSSCLESKLGKGAEGFGIACRVVEHDEALDLKSLHQDQRIVRRRGAGTLAVIDRDHAALDDAAKQVHLGGKCVQRLAADIVEIDIDAFGADRT